MFEFTRNFYKAPGNGGGSEFIGPGTVIIPEQTVETLPPMEGADPSATLDSVYKIGPDKLLINFNGTDYEVKAVKDGDIYVYDYPLGAKDDRLFRITLFPPQGWVIVTPNQGTYTISAEIPEEKSTPKVFTFPKGRTIVSELSRLNKAFGTISTKKTIIGQLSDLADAAEAGKIGGGSGGAFIVHVSANELTGLVMDKTWQEIYDALKTTYVYVDVEAEMSVSAIRIIAAGVINGTYWVRSDTSDEFKTNSSDGYPTKSLEQ